MATHDEVAHNWAYQTGKKAKGHAMFYDGDTIYSWGYHFPIAQFVETPNVGGVILFNKDKRSVSTSKHQTIVHRSIPKAIQVIEVPDLTRTIEQNYMALLEEAKELAERAKRARIHKASCIYAMVETIEAANLINTVFQLGHPEFEKPDNVQQMLDAFAEMKKQEEEEQAAKDRAAISKWINGEEVRPPHTKVPYVRVKGDAVQTSWGVIVPLKEALPLFRLSAKCAARGQGFKPTTKEHMIGMYNLDCITDEGTLKVGCHIIPLKVQKHAAKLAGLIPA